MAADDPTRLSLVLPRGTRDNLMRLYHRQTGEPGGVLGLSNWLASIFDQMWHDKLAQYGDQIADAPASVPRGRTPGS